MIYTYVVGCGRACHVWEHGRYDGCSGVVRGSGGYHDQDEHDQEYHCGRYL